ncbi:MAG: ExbD/TolR family protein [Chitinophagales bacterium]
MARKVQEINASSMADIAFLLLIFFLVTTTMDIDKGILVLLPPWSEEPPEDQQFNKRNVLEILVNKNDDLLIEGERLSVGDLKELAKTHVTNNGRNPKYSDTPQKAVISLKNDRGTSYDMYISVQNELKAAYNELRNDYAKNTYGVDYNTLQKDKQREVRNVYPLRISEAEPENFGG